MITGSAHPQGGPFGPPLMQMWVLAGVVWCTTAGQLGLDPTATREESFTESKREAEGLSLNGSRKRRPDAREEKPPKRRKIEQRTYMDDRTVVARTRKEVIKRVCLWHQWSEGVELNENEAKKQFVAKGPRLKQELIEGLPAADRQH